MTRRFTQSIVGRFQSLSPGHSEPFADKVPPTFNCVRLRSFMGSPTHRHHPVRRVRQIDYRVGDGDWTRMKRYVTDDYGLRPDQFNQVHPAAPLTCDAISIRILPQVGYCMGMHELRIGFEE